ncbi:olfactomedin-like [Varanus komodoensis]|uniref:olfactomedin-like n=1 Tax=Varanus komodoensis TaxID=61221 RepID=UPI001CF7D762|nr:olfactomedin-like [Varanus komodoensis]
MTSLVTADYVIFHDAPVPRHGEDNDECICSVELPETTFPGHMIDYLEDIYKNLTVLIDKETEKFAQLHNEIDGYNKKLENVTHSVILMETDGIKDEKEFLAVTQTIQDMKKRADTLSNLLNGTDLDIEDLLNKVNNVSSMVWQLETFDKNNVLATRREMAILRKQLADCEEAAVNPSFGLPSAGLTGPEYGKCENKFLVNVSKPFIVKLNWRGFSYRYGAWGKDFAFGNPTPDMYWVAPLNTDERLMETYRLYNSYSDLLLYKNQIEKSLSQYIGLTWNYVNCGQGSGPILFNGSFYYNCHNSRNLCKLNIATHELQRVTLEGAAFNNWFSYAGVNWQDFDFAGDEKGLWIIYSTESSKGKIIIGKLDPNTMNMIQKWQTSLFKPNATNTFMICGVLYALKRVSAHKEKIFYTYDTNTGMEGTTDIMIEKLAETFQSVSYNPNDHKLYMYNDGYLVTYDGIIKSKPQTERRSVASENTQNAVIPFRNTE